MQLLEDVQRSRRELENTFDSIAHLVVVYDLRGRIVRANQAFASRLKLTREQLIDRPLAESSAPSSSRGSRRTMPPTRGLPTNRRAKSSTPS